MANILINNNLSPEERLKCLISYTSNVEIDPNVSAKLYYRSGLNMFKQFNIYYKECNWENALCIYLKYELLFFDKIKKHPGYNQIPVNIKSVNAANFRLMKLKAEHARRELFKQYKREYMSYCDELKRNKGMELIECLKALENSKGIQTMEKHILGISKDLARNSIISSSDNSRKRDSERFRSITASIKSNSVKTADQKIGGYSQEPKASKGGNEIFRSKPTGMKANDFSNVQQRVSDSFYGSKMNKDGSEIFKLKNTSLKGYNFNNTQQRESGSYQGPKIKGGSEIFRSKTTDSKASDLNKVHPRLSATFQAPKIKGSIEVFKSKATSVKPNDLHNEYQRLTENIHEPKQMDFNKEVHKLESIQKNTRMSANGFNAQGKKKSKDQPLEGKNSFNPKGSLKNNDDKGNMKHQEFK